MLYNAHKRAITLQVDFRESNLIIPLIFHIQTNVTMQERLTEVIFLIPISHDEKNRLQVNNGEGPHQVLNVAPPLL